MEKNRKSHELGLYEMDRHPPDPCLLVPGLLDGWADTSYLLHPASLATEHSVREEALYLKEETVSIASRYEQLISQAPSDVYVITDEEIRSSGATNVPTLLRHVPGMEVMQTNVVDFNVSVRGNNEL